MGEFRLGVELEPAIQLVQDLGSTAPGGADQEDTANLASYARLPSARAAASWGSVEALETCSAAEKACAVP